MYIIMYTIEYSCTFKENLSYMVKYTVHSNVFLVENQ